MEEILRRCVELDTAAEQAYRLLASACPDPGLARTFERMAAEEWAHVQWWTELQGAYVRGLVPEPADPDELLVVVNETAKHIEGLLQLDIATMSCEQMLEFAVRFEFFMLDPVFGELIDLLDTSGARHHHDAYSRHVMRLVHELETREEHDGLTSFLARVLSRAYTDRDRLVTLATRDPLTMLYNRRGYYGFLTSWCAWSERYEHALAVLLIDVDHFKTVNDTWGHPAGDEVLRTIAQALGHAVRGSDIVGRYGGDEFAVLAPETGADAVAILAERVLEAVHSAHFEVAGDEFTLSVSVGCAWVPAGTHVTPEQLLSAADVSLYEAKRAGRDRAGAPIEVRATVGA